MKVLFLSRRFYPDDGGIEKHIRKISKRLIDQGYEISLVTQTPGKLDNYLGIKIIRIPKVSKNTSEKLHLWKWFWDNRRLIQESDIIHAHDVYWWYWPYRFIFLSKKSFVTFHGYESYPVRRGAILSRKLSEFLANGNIIVGDFMKKWYHAKPTYSIFGGVDIPKGNSKLNNDLSAVFIGRLDEHTGVLDYAKAIDKIRKKYPKFKFEILGDGEYSAILKKYSLLGFQKNIDNYLQRNNFAFVSRYLSILEALANRRLVVAHYDNPIKKDYLKISPFSKFIIIENSSELLADKVKYFLENKKEKEKIINNGFNWVKKQSWENVVNTYIKLWGK